MRDRIKKCCIGFFSYEVNRFEIVCSVLISAVLFFNLYYEDNLYIFLCYFWNNEGLFDLNGLDALGNNRLAYGIVQQFIGQAWCLPVNFWYHFFGMEQVANAWSVLWYKMSVIPFFVLILREMSVLSKRVGIEKEDKNWMLLIFSTTILVSLPTFHIAQTDAIYIFFLLRGLRFYLEDDYKRFLVYMMLAINCKYIALFVFIPLVLLREKRILRILRDCVIGVILTPIQMIWYKIVNMLNCMFFPKNADVISRSEGTTTYATVNQVNEANVGFLSHYYNKVLYFEMPAIRKTYVASFLIVIFGLLCVWCYLKHTEEKEEVIDSTLFAGFVAFLIFFSWASPNPYWMVALYPIAFLLMFRHKERLRVNLLIESVYTGSMFFILLDSLPHVFGGPNNFNFMPLKELFGFIPDHSDMPVEMGPSVYGFLEKLGIPQIMPVIVAICLVCFIAWIVINYPTKKQIFCDYIGEKELSVFRHGVLMFNILCLLCWFILCVYCVGRY